MNCVAACNVPARFNEFHIRVLLVARAVASVLGTFRKRRK